MAGQNEVGDQVVGGESLARVVRARPLVAATSVQLLPREKWAGLDIGNRYRPVQTKVLENPVE